MTERENMQVPSDIKEGLISLFFNRQHLLNQSLQQKMSLSRLKEKAYQSIKTRLPLSHTLNLIGKKACFKEYIQDPLYAEASSCLVSDVYQTTEPIFAVFDKGDADLEPYFFSDLPSFYIFRSGFFSQEYDIYTSVLKGFQGMFFSLTPDIDLWTLQYFIEIARDINFVLLPVVETERHLELIKETDTPYFMVSLRCFKKLPEARQFIEKVSRRVASNFTVFCHLSQFSFQKEELIKESGLNYFFFI